MTRIFAKDRVGTIVGNFNILNWKRENGRTLYYVECLLCNQKKWMRADSVLNEKVVSCGCYNEENNYKKIKDIKGLRSGRIVAINPTKDRDKDSGSVIWECKCDCGNTKYVAEYSLSKKSVRSCGCLGTENSRKNGVIAGNFIKENFCVEGTNVNNFFLSARGESGIKGVIFDKDRGKWRAQISFKGKHYNLGRYENIKDAVKARKAAENAMFGDFLEWYKEEYPEMYEKIKHKNLTTSNSKE